MDVPNSLKILVVEDDAGDVLLLKEALKHAYSDFEFWHVRTVTEAYDFLQKNRPDVVILDLSLPDGVGVEVVHKMHACAMQIPIVVLTGRDDEAMALICLNAGAQDFLSKSSLKSVALRRSIAYALSRQRESAIKDCPTDLTDYQKILSDMANQSLLISNPVLARLKVSDPDIYGECCEQFRSLFVQYANYLNLKNAKPNLEMSAFISKLSHLGGGVGDLIDMQMILLRFLQESNAPGVENDHQRDDALRDKDFHSERFLNLFGFEMMTLLANVFRQIADSR
ncbi:MAG: response regulator [Burkholderiales bacterium]|nr:response regulator [Burkholderiales bacterium]